MTARMRLAALAFAGALPLSAQAAESAPLTLDQKMQLRCSAAFAIVAGEQRRGVATALAWPALGERGREYFVRSAARLMDSLGLSREQLEGLLHDEVESLQRQAIEAEDPKGFVQSVMQPCLVALDASGI